jgi:hypothetical protein
MEGSDTVLCMMRAQGQAWESLIPELVETGVLNYPAELLRYLDKSKRQIL